MVCTKCEKVLQRNPFRCANRANTTLRNSPRSPRQIHLNQPLSVSRTARAKSARTNSLDARNRQEQLPALVEASLLRVQRIDIRSVWCTRLETCAVSDVYDYASPTQANVRTASHRSRRIKRNIVMVRPPHQILHVLCQRGPLGCAFKKGICSICGKQILDTSGYQMVNK